MKHIILISLLVFGGCKISVDDKRLSREEVGLAFQQRDTAIAALLKRVEALEGKKK